MLMRDLIDRAIRNLELLKEAVPEGREQGSHQSDYPHHFQHGDWDCEDSPTKYCMYTNLDYDVCIFCHEPYERK